MTHGETVPCLIECTLVLAGRDCDPDECLAAIGLAGGTTWLQARAALAANPSLNNAEVRYQVGPIVAASIDEPLTQLLAWVTPAADRIARCAEQHALSLGVTCLVKVYTERPLYDLSAVSMRALANLGARFSMDLLDLR